MTSTNNTKSWCAIPNCTKNNQVEKRYFFRFPNEHDRWLAWVHACGRLDLIPKGPYYAHRNMRLCHLHFDEKWISLTKRANLHKDAVPTKLLPTSCDTENVSSALPAEEIVFPLLPSTKENKSIDVNASIVEPSTSTTTTLPGCSCKEKYVKKIQKLRVEKRKLQEMNRRLLKKIRINN